ncbi:hypothetical protein [Glutamicibacter sp. NPDC087344]|uniref:hypothetical protein n=1 Tax=Glutamicibacter sp. NPDC087344 TaxID=3363994 RepID=UPI003817189C
MSLSPGKASLRAFVRALAAEQAPGGVRATVITLNGGVNSGAESWSASVVAQDYLDLHHQEAVSWTAEVVRN